MNVDDALLEVLAAFSEAADATKTPWLVIGATARILLLEKVYGWSKGSGTRDIDFAVQVGDWDHYNQLCEHLLKNNMGETQRSPTKRFTSKQNMVFDLVPYGGVENENKQVLWPPHNDDVMTVRGFDGAANDAVHVNVNNELDVPIVSPCGLCALKLFAWEERHEQHPGRDAKDIAYLFTHIESLYTAEKIYEQHIHAIEVADYVIHSAGHYQLGCHVQDLLNDDDHAFMESFLAKELDKNEDSVLCRELLRYTKPESINETLEALNFFNDGLRA